MNHLRMLLVGGAVAWGALAPTTVLAQAAAPSPSSAPADRPTGSNSNTSSAATVQLAEVIVTASRREENVQSVAGGIQVFGGAELERAGAKQMSDYILAVPGVSFRDQGGGATRIAMRGVSDIGARDNGIGAMVSTTGMYVNDISIVDTSNVPDLALYDLERIEVLKGPQGTLYGDGAMGGAVKMILKSPNLAKFEGRAETALSGTTGGGFNSLVRGVVNLPLVADRLGLRLAASHEDRDGFIDNIATGQRNFNGSDQHSMRGTLLWKPTDALSVELLALYNKQSHDALDQIDNQLPDLQMAILERQNAAAESRIFGLTLKYDLGFAELSSISAYYGSKHERGSRVPQLAQALAGFGTVTQGPAAAATDLSTVSQELRLVSSGDRRLNWIAGAYYRDKKQDGSTRIFLVPADVPSVNTGLGFAGLPLLPADGTIIDNPTHEQYEQHAVYGEVNFKLLEKLELTGGLRWFEEKANDVNITTGYSLFAFASQTVSGERKENGLIPKVGLSYKLDDDHLIYAQAAKGFRSGVVNNFQSFQVGGDGADSDSLWNYELGTKNSWLGRRLRVNGSVFYVDWKKVQLFGSAISPIAPPSTGPLSFYMNGGDAELYGAELELALAPGEAWLLGANAGYTHSEMVRASPGTNLIAGAPLPNVPEWTASGFVEYRTPVTANSKGFARFDMQYTGRQTTLSITPSVPDGLPVDGYSIGKLQLGVEADRWLAALFVDNLWDTRAQLGRGLAGNGVLNPEFITIARPCTYGIRASISF